MLTKSSSRASRTREEIEARPFTVHVVDPNEPLAEEARAVEADVFGERYGNSREFLDEMYADYDHATTFVVVRDERAGVAVGMLRLVVGTDAGLPGLHGLRGTRGTSTLTAPSRDPFRTSIWLAVWTSP